MLNNYTQEKNILKSIIQYWLFSDIEGGAGNSLGKAKEF